MPTNPEPRNLMYFPVGGSASGTVERLQHHGWRLSKVDGVEAALRLLRQQPEAHFAGLLELAGGSAAGDAGAFVEELVPALVAPRMSWVAAVAPEQLQWPWIRRLIHEYCHDYVTLPCADALLDRVLGHAHGMSSLAETDAAALQPAVDGMLGESPVMRAMFRDLRKAASSEAPVFIAGETGTGKELAAIALHRNSARRQHPFVVINCGAIPQGLVQSELFGYERGAFTGASQRKLGRIETANRGVLFLDEIGDMPMDAQASLLRFLQQGSIERLGGHDEIRLDVRIISATHVDLAEAVAQGRFREDLYHRLRVIELQQPPLRERGHDIELIATHALHQYADECGRRIRGFSPCALHAMRQHRWPGNVRELVNRVRQAMAMAEHVWISAHDLRLQSTVEDVVTQTLEQARCHGELTAIRSALDRNGHRLIATARELGISRVTLYRLMVKHGLRDHEQASMS